MKKIALFAFNGELTCFVHVLLNALDLKAKGHTVGIVIEGAATKLVPELSSEGNPTAFNLIIFLIASHRFYRQSRPIN